MNAEHRDNPWLGIPAADYEGHMSSPGVEQLQFLARVFAEVIGRFQPESIVVLGCATGNGFEHIDPARVRRLVGVDINPEYLEITRRRFDGRIPGLELVCADLAECNLARGSFDLVHAALILEYVEPASVLRKAFEWLRPGGVLAAVLQSDGGNAAKVSATPFESLKRLESAMRLLPAPAYRRLAAEHGFIEVKSDLAALPGGKAFFVGVHKRPAESAE